MELYEVTVAGYRKFRDLTRLKTHGKLVSVLGANEAGKSSLLSAIERLNDDDGFEPAEISHDLSSDKVGVQSKFLLDDDDRVAAGVQNAIWFIVEKRADGTRSWNILPRPQGRDTSHREKLLADVGTLSTKPKFSEISNEHDPELLSELVELLGGITELGEDLPPETITELEEISARFAQLNSRGIPAYARAVVEELQRATSTEKAPNRRTRAGQLLWNRVPKILLFGQQHRNLKTSYSVAALKEEVPAALANLLAVAEGDLAQLIEHYEAGEAAKVDTVLDAVNERLGQKFRDVWKQSAISVVLSLRDQTLHVQVRNPDKRRTSFSERSDGLRQFVALQSFTAASGETDPILLIDEAEQHLHYDAQADLVKMLASQEVSPKVIYTTHSAGCLPEDLGNGVRLVGEVSPDSEWSRVRNKFWDSKQTTLSPLLIGMGASTLAFFPTRVAVVVEGESDMLLYPSMVQRCFNERTTGMQFVPGLSRIDRHQLPMLQTVGNRVAYLLDNDPGGRTLAGDLSAVGIESENIFFLQRPGKGNVELEDFIDSDLLASAVNELGRRHYANAEIVLAKKLPRYGKWDHIVAACAASNVEPFQKPDLAYSILDLLASDPTKLLIDPRLNSHFAKSIGALREHLKIAEKEEG